MLSDAVRRRLELLNRAPLAGQTAAPTEAAPTENATLPPRPGSVSTFERGVPAGSTLSAGITVPAESYARSASGGEEFENAAGKHLRLRRRLSEFAPAVCAALRPTRPAALLERPAAHPELAALAAGFPDAALFLDLETCGFAGSMIFLVGLIHHTGGELWLDQLLARNYAEERAVLATLWQVAGPGRVLVTFNGKSFDWPMVCDRSTLHRLLPPAARRQSLVRLRAAPRPMWEKPRPAAGRTSELESASVAPEWHCDLLHHARRRWRGRLPDCRLQTLERFICRRQRVDDVPGAQVPGIYHDYVRSGQLAELAGVLHHNALDLLTLVQIAQTLSQPLWAAAESA